VTAESGKKKGTSGGIGLCVENQCKQLEVAGKINRTPARLSSEKVRSEKPFWRSELQFSVLLPHCAFAKNRLPNLTGEGSAPAGILATHNILAAESPCECPSRAARILKQAHIRMGTYR